MRKSYPAEGLGILSVDSCIFGELVAPPKDECGASRLEEHRFLDLLTLPAELLLERPGSAYTGHSKRDQTDALVPK